MVSETSAAAAPASADRHSGPNLEFDFSFAQGANLFSGAAKDHGVAALEPHNIQREK
ncbi:MAG: hypothetical protein WBS24_05490 [Terriglobales bacterium]